MVHLVTKVIRDGHSWIEDIFAVVSESEPRDVLRAVTDDLREHRASVDLRLTWTLWFIESSEALDALISAGRRYRTLGVPETMARLCALASNPTPALMLAWDYLSAANRRWLANHLDRAEWEDALWVAARSLPHRFAPIARKATRSARPSFVSPTELLRALAVAPGSFSAPQSPSWDIEGDTFSLAPFARSPEKWGGGMAGLIARCATADALGLKQSWTSDEEQLAVQLAQDRRPVVAHALWSAVGRRGTGVPRSLVRCVNSLSTELLAEAAVASGRSVCTRTLPSRSRRWQSVGLESWFAGHGWSLLRALQAGMVRGETNLALLRLLPPLRSTLRTPGLWRAVLALEDGTEQSHHAAWLRALTRHHVLSLPPVRVGQQPVWEAWSGQVARCWADILHGGRAIPAHMWLWIRRGRVFGGAARLSSVPLGLFESRVQLRLGGRSVPLSLSLQWSDDTVLFQVDGNRLS